MHSVFDCNTLTDGSFDPLRRVNASEQYQFLVAPVLWTATMGIKRMFENIEMPVRIVGAGTLDAAISQIRKNRNYTALLIDWDEAGKNGVELACAAKENTEIPVVVFQKKWERDDLRRALQLGVDILLPESFSPHDLFTELQTLKEIGESTSRRRILDKAGEELLQPDPDLWSDQAENWRDRMMSLADQLVRPWSEDTANKASHLESSVVRGSEFDQLPAHFARAMLEVVECGRDRLPEIAGQYRIPAKELSAMSARMESFCNRHGGLSKMPLLLDEVIKKNSEEDLLSPPQLSLLHRVSRVVIKSQGKPSHRQDALNETIRKFTGVPTELLEHLTIEHRFKLAIGMLNVQSFDKAIDRIGYFVVGLILRRLRNENADQNDINALNSLLGFDARYSSIRIKSLVRNLAILNPIPSLHYVELSDIRLCVPLLEQMELQNSVALHSAVEQLADMGRPMGPIDQKRLKDLLNAVKYELPVLLARPAWISLYRLLTSEVSEGLGEIRDRFLFIVGARRPEPKERLITALQKLIEVGRHVMDAARFAELCRNATITLLDSALIADYVDDIHEEFSKRPSGRSGAAEERAILDQALAGFNGFPIDVSELKDNLPPRLAGMPELSPLEEARLRVLAAGLELLPSEKHEAAIQHFLQGHKLHPEELDALTTLLGESASLSRLGITLVDQSGTFRDGFDEMLEESVVLDLKLDQVEFSAEDDWDEDILAVDEETIEGASFSRPSQAQKIISTPPPAVSNVPVDLGFDELEMELDLEGGSLDSSMMIQQMLEEEDEGAFVHTISTSDEWTPPLEPRKRPLMNTDSFVAVDEEALLTNREQPSVIQQVDESDFMESSFDFNQNFSRNTPRFSEMDEMLTELDFEQVRELLKAGKLTDAAKYLGRFSDDTEDLVDALNLTALHAYVGKHYRAADVLWKRALNLSPEALNLLFNYSRLLVAVGKNAEATNLLNRFAQRKPNFSPAQAMLKELNS